MWEQEGAFLKEIEPRLRRVANNHHIAGVALFGQMHPLLPEAKKRRMVKAAISKPFDPVQDLIVPSGRGAP